MLNTIVHYKLNSRVYLYYYAYKNFTNGNFLWQTLYNYPSIIFYFTKSLNISMLYNAKIKD